MVLQDYKNQGGSTRQRRTARRVEKTDKKLKMWDFVTEVKIADSSQINPYKTKMMLREEVSHNAGYEEDCALGCSSVGVQFFSLFLLSPQ